MEEQLSLFDYARLSCDGFDRVYMGRLDLTFLHIEFMETANKRKKTSLDFFSFLRDKIDLVESGKLKSPFLDFRYFSPARLIDEKV